MSSMHCVPDQTEAADGPEDDRSVVILFIGLRPVMSIEKMLLRVLVTRARDSDTSGDLASH